MSSHVKKFLRHDTHPLIQFIKYGMAGGIATGVDCLIFYFVAWKFFPALTLDDPLVKLFQQFGEVDLTVVTESIRQRNFVASRVMAFMVSNFVCYIMNILWVFKPGKHSRKKELGLFYAVSIVSFIVGTTVGWALIHFVHISTTSAYLANIIAAIMINYVCRKYIVFKG